MAQLTKRLVWVALGLMVAIAMSALAPAAAAVPAKNASPAKAVPITLHGSAVTPLGWGYGANNISNPGPNLMVDQGDVITFTLFAADDPTAHTLVIDLNGDGAGQASEPTSEVFTSATTGVPFTYTANTAGTIQYICGLHGTSMRGTLTVRGAPPGDNTILIVGGVLVVVAIVAVAAAMMIRKKAKPPLQPPAQ